MWGAVTVLAMIAGILCLAIHPALGGALMGLSLWAGFYTEGSDDRVAVNLVGWALLLAGLIALTA